MRLAIVHHHSCNDSACSSICCLRREYFQFAVINEQTLDIEDIFNDTQSIDPKNPTILRFMAFDYYFLKEKNIQKARDCFQRVFLAFPEESRALANYGKSIYV